MRDRARETELETVRVRLRRTGREESESGALFESSMARIWLELLWQYTMTYTGEHAQWNTLMDMGEVKAKHVRFFFTHTVFLAFYYYYY